MCPCVRVYLRSYGLIYVSPEPKRFDECCPFSLFKNLKVIYRCMEEPGWRSRYSDSLRAGRPRGRSSRPGRVKNFLFFTSSRPALGSFQPIPRVPGALSRRVKRPGREADHSPPASAEVRWTNYGCNLTFAFYSYK
jgi:hypothetical protein